MNRFLVALLLGFLAINGEMDLLCQIGGAFCAW